MLMTIVRNHFPQVIVTALGPPLMGVIPEDEMGDLTDEQLSEVNENYAETFFNPSCTLAFCEYLGVTDSSRVNIRSLHGGRDSPETRLGLTVGSNHEGVIEPGDIEKIRNFLAPYAPNEEPMWYLHVSRGSWQHAKTGAKERGEHELLIYSDHDLQLPCSEKPQSMIQAAKKDASTQTGDAII